MSKDKPRATVQRPVGDKTGQQGRQLLQKTSVSQADVPVDDPPPQRRILDPGVTAPPGAREWFIEQVAAEAVRRIQERKAGARKEGTQREGTS